MDRLPRELKLLIFEKMPIKSLGLSMCVAKSWRSMIKNTSFVLSYSTVNRNVSRNELLIFQPSDDFLEVCLDEVGFGLYKQFDIPLASDGGEVLMNGFCKGIICTINNEGSIFLWNPTIRKTLTLPQEVPGLIDRQNPADRVGMIEYRNPALGFDSITNDYKVVTYVSGNSSDRILDDVIVYSLNNNCWRVHNSPSPKYDEFEHSLFFNGFIYWVARTNLSFEILTFHVNSEEFGVIKLPERTKRCDKLMLSIYKDSTIGICNSKFNIIDQDLEIWVMGNSGGVDSWNKIWTVTIDARINLRHVYPPVPLGFRMNGDLFVQESYDHEAPGPFPRSTQFIYSVDVGTALSEVLTIRNFRLQTSIVCYFEESLVLLDNPLAETVYINVFRPCV